MNSAPPRRASVPTSGHPAISDLATCRIGVPAVSTRMSSQETWFATTSPGPLRGSPWLSMLNPNARSVSCDAARTARPPRRTDPWPLPRLAVTTSSQPRMTAAPTSVSRNHCAGMDLTGAAVAPSTAHRASQTNRWQPMAMSAADGHEVIHIARRDLFVVQQNGEIRGAEVRVPGRPCAHSGAESEVAAQQRRGHRAPARFSRPIQSGTGGGAGSPARGPRDRRPRVLPQWLWRSPHRRPTRPRRSR